jgi:hypothetical protein
MCYGFQGLHDDEFDCCCCGHCLQELAMFKDGVARFKGAGSSSSKQQEGDSSDLTGARVVTTMIVNGVPRTAVEVVEGVRKFRCDPAVWLCTSIQNQVWLVAALVSVTSAASGLCLLCIAILPAAAPTCLMSSAQAEFHCACQAAFHAVLILSSVDA